MADNEIDHIAELQKRLYARDPDSVPQRKYGILRPLKDNVTSSWGETTVDKEKSIPRSNITGYKRFFIFSLIFFLIALGAATFSVFRGAVTLSSKNVDLTVLGNSFTGGGETLPLQVEVANKNSADLIHTTIALDYPKGATDTTGSETTHVTQDIGTVPSGKSTSTAFSVVLYGEQGTTRDIVATIDYQLKGSNATFEKKTTFTVSINSSPIALTVDGPAAIGTNQPLTLTIHTLYSGDQTLSNAITRVEYPNGFVFGSATPAPSANNNIWSLGDMEKGAAHDIVIHGKLIGEQNEEKSFRIYTGIPVSGDNNHIGVAYSSALKTITIQQPFISGSIDIGGQTGDIVALPIGSSITGVVKWTNNATVPVTNPIFTLALVGDNINADSITPEKGYYNALDRTITWTAESDSDLQSLAPGATGQLNFSFNQKNPVDTSDIKLSLSVQGMFPDRNNDVQSIQDIDQKTVRFASRLQFASTALYSIGPIKNTGPFPPKANQETSYSISWTARPSENALTGMVATAVLPPGVTWAGVIVPTTEQISYAPDTRIITWNIGTMARASTTPVKRMVTFQIKIRPTKSQVGGDLPLLGSTSVSATDAVANVPLSITRPALSTRLDADPAYTPGSEKVLP